MNQEERKNVNARLAGLDDGIRSGRVPVIDAKTSVGRSKGQAKVKTHRAPAKGRVRRVAKWLGGGLVIFLLVMVAVEWSPYVQVTNARPEDYFAKGETGVYLRPEGSLIEPVREAQAKPGEEEKQEDKKQDVQEFVRVASAPPVLKDVSNLPPLLVKGVPAVEDRWLGWYPGVNPYRIAVAGYRNWRAGKTIEGASSIHQQVARSFYLNREKTYGRKILEARLAFALWLSKDSNQVLGLYTSVVAMGSRGGIPLRGFYEASQAWFGKSPDKLTIGQQAILAGMPKGPSIFNPGAPRCKERRDQVLDIWQKAGVITAAQAAAAKAEPIKAASFAAGTKSYAGDSTLEELDSIMSRVNGEQQTQYKATEVQAYSTVSLEAQRRLEAAIASQEKAITAAIGSNAWQVSAMLVNVNTREVLAAVGGRDYAKSSFNRLNASVPTGSAFKPFVYAQGIETGNIGLMTRLQDKAGLAFQFAGLKDPYQVGNHDNLYDQEVSVRTALVKSKNVPAVDLVYQLGIPNAFALAKRAGLPANDLPSTVLGSTNATVRQVARAYTALARGGTAVDLSFIRKVVHQGQVIYDLSKDTLSEEVMSPATAYLTTSALVEVSQSGGTGAIIDKMGFKQVLAVKTGSGQYAWCVAYAPNGLLLVVCIGFDVPGDYASLLAKLFGGTSSARVQGAFWSNLFKDHKDYFGTQSKDRKDKFVARNFAVPQTVERITCTLSDGTETTDWAVKGRGCQLAFVQTPETAAQPSPEVSSTPAPSPTPLTTEPAEGATAQPQEGAQPNPGVITIPDGPLKRPSPRPSPSPNPVRPGVMPTPGVITIPDGPFKRPSPQPKPE